MKRLLALILLLAVFVLPGTLAAAGSPVRARPVFGQGPEIHLLPSFAVVGTKIHVIGLGYKAGDKVRIMYGPPNAEFAPSPLATATVLSDGTFRVVFTLTRSMMKCSGATVAPCRHGFFLPPRPLIIGGFGRDATTAVKTQSTALVITAA